MNVTLVSTTHNSQEVAKLAAAVCVGREDKSQLINNKTSPEVDESLNKGLNTAIASGHLGILEHISFTWLISGVSRALTHQLVRHRLASYDQQSQRYCKISTDNQDWYVIPPSIADNNEIKQLYYKAMNGIATIYNELLEAGIPKEDARMVLPNSCKTTILTTMNARAFIEAAEKRLCNRAQWEIRDMFHMMRRCIKYVNPLVFCLAVPRCAKYGCIESKPCGHPWS